MQINFPLSTDARGRTATTNDQEHIRDLVEQVLFTSPGERVNRPDFGCGLLQMVFAPASDELATATQFLVQGSLQQWLGDLIVVENVEVIAVDSTVEVQVIYEIRRNNARQVERFSREIA